MKANHTRHALLILCIAAILSLTACGGSEIETTAQKVIETTEESTTSANAITTEVPEKNTSETTTPANTEKQTEEVTTEEITTEEITEEATEDPAVLEIIAEIPEFFDKKEVFEAPHTSGLTSEMTANGVMFVNPNNKDGAITFFSGRVGDKVTGQYFFIKYRTTENTHITIYTATDLPSPTNFRSKNLDASNYLLTDENWHLAIVDITTLFEFAANEIGLYTALHLKLDVEGGAGVWAEIAYVGLTDDLEDILKYVQATESEADIQSVCPCIVPFQSVSYHDKNTHEALCKLCGKKQYLSHSGADHGTWKDNHNYYLSDTPCGVCGIRYNFGSNLFIEAESIRLSESAWTTSSFVAHDNGVTYTQLFTNSESGIWSAGYFSINPNKAVSGQYLVVRYRVPKSEGELVLTIQADTTNSGTSGYKDVHDIPLIVDNDWHVAVIDLSITKNYVLHYTGVYTISPASRILTTSWGPDDYVQLDWFKMYDNLDNIPEEYLQETVIIENKTE